MKSKINNQFEQYFERMATSHRRYSPDLHKIKSSTELKAISDLSTLSIQQVIAKSIVDFESEFSKLNTNIRADAKVLLTINFSNMIYYPLVQAGILERNGLKKEIYEEVKLILSEASNGNEEISSHKILETGLKLWERLKTLGNDSW